MPDDGYTTPEGHWLAKPLLMPDARAFSDVLEYVAEWNHATMSHHAGELPAGHERPEPRYIVAGARNEIGPFCTVDLDGQRNRSIAVRATDAVLEAVAPRIVTPDDHLSFKVIEHHDRGRALVILNHGYISGSHWLAYIDPATIPPYPFEERDRRAREIHDAMQEAGRRPVRRQTRDQSIEYVDGHGGPLAARIDATGAVTRRWTDGTVSQEPVS